MCAGPPAVLGWATGHLPEPPNNPQVGHGEHAGDHAGAAARQAGAGSRASGLAFARVALPKQLRETRIVKDTPPDEIAREIVEWIR